MAGFAKLIAAFWLCAITALPAVGGSLVLCIGTNQHLSIEELFAMCCGRSYESRLPAPSQTSGTGFGTAQSAPACGSCVDIPLMSSTAENKAAIAPPVQQFSRLPIVVPASQTGVSEFLLPRSAAALPDTTDVTGHFTVLNSVLRC